LTKKGRALASAIDAMAAWAERWVEVDVRPSKAASRARRRA
jgi:DNA-binding HxlR family transcriptional regulator